MPDGKHILFSSDRPGGAGGFDLWMADLDANGNPTNITNMGSGVNTMYDEQAPSYHAASNTFVFSSNGRVGMGGFDFYYSKGPINSLSEPKNFGHPVNSVKDDLYFTSRGSATNILENVLISSDRDAACCLELFALNKTKAMKEISGTVLACDSKKPLAGVKVLIVDAANKTIAEKTTDASGKYSFTIAEFEALKASASSKGYFANSISFTGPADIEEEFFTNPELCLNLIPEEAIRVENVFYDFNKATLQETSYESLDKLVQILNDNPTIIIELGAHTDSKGTDEYNQKLSQARAKSVVEYLVSKGISRSRLMAKGYGETVPAAENTNADGTDNPEGRQLNRRTEFKVLKN
jgi:outer membrane protein OmpA-like peptidoglycan-associated protein